MTTGVNEHLRIVNSLKGTREYRPHGIANLPPEQMGLLVRCLNLVTGSRQTARSAISLIRRAMIGLQQFDVSELISRIESHPVNTTSAEYNKTRAIDALGLYHVAMARNLQHREVMFPMLPQDFLCGERGSYWPHVLNAVNNLRQVVNDVAMLIEWSIRSDVQYNAEMRHFRNPIAATENPTIPISRETVETLLLEWPFSYVTVPGSNGGVDWAFYNKYFPEFVKDPQTGVMVRVLSLGAWIYPAYRISMHMLGKFENQKDQISLRSIFPTGPHGNYDCAVINQYVVNHLLRVIGLRIGNLALGHYYYPGRSCSDAGFEDVVCLTKAQVFDPVEPKNSPFIRVVD